MPQFRTIFGLLILGLAMALPARTALAAADAEAPPATPVRDPNRLEWAPFPVVGGNSDMGIVLGIQPIFAKFDPAYDPYKYRIQAQFAVGLKWWDGRGFYVPTHMDFFRVDLPGLAGGRLRIYINAEYNQRNNAGYFGIGNASRYEQPPLDLPSGTVVLRGHKRFQFQQIEPSLRVNFRYRLTGPLYLMTGVRLMWERTNVYEGSVLWEDRAGLRGLHDHLALQAAAGLTYDTRNHEYTPWKGLFCEAQVRFSPGLGNDMHFGGFSLDGRSYNSIYGEYLVVASRVFADMLFGNVPFYELSRASAFESRQYPGGRDGFRGVPEGRYRGRIKIGGDVELRSMFWTFWLWGERFRVGGLLLADVGRVWADWKPNPALDGRDVGLKYGVGTGLRIQIGETVLARFDLSYSPDAAASGMPFGFYADINHVF